MISGKLGSSGVILIILGLFLVLFALLSLRWGLVEDTPIIAYLAWLMDHHQLPYRDFFDMNTPGSYFLHILFGRLFGYSDFGLRCFDLLYLSAILAGTWFWIKNFGARVAGYAAVLFGLFYLGLGHAASLERDYLIILPVLAALIVTTSFPRLSPALRGLLTGFCFGLAALIKPHSMIGLLPVAVFLYWEYRHQGRSRIISGFQAVTFPALGLALPLLALVAWLWKAGIGSYFLGIARHYWPLYNELTGDNRLISGSARARYILREYTGLGHQGLWLAPTALGLFVALYLSHLAPALKRQAILAASLTFCYSLYTLLAGKFWPYHWLPFMFFMILTASLCLVKQKPGVSAAQKRFVPAVLMLTLLLQLHSPPGFLAWVGGDSLDNQKDRPAEEIAAFLKAGLKPGDTVQPLDWSAGAVHAMLMAQARIATPFVYDFCFYHHVSSPYIQNLRMQFITGLEAAPPRFIINMTNKTSVSGENCTNRFPELEGLLSRSYHIAKSGEEYVIYARNEQNNASG